MATENSRLWLMVPSKLITRPILWELGKKFEVVTNLRQASVTDEIGIVSLSLEGERAEIKKAIAWLEELGVKVEPVEINTIEGRRNAAERRKACHPEPERCCRRTKMGSARAPRVVFGSPPETPY